MTIQVFNTLSGKKEDFVPISGKKVLMYACGPTVYDLSHLGHARTFIIWDVVYRYLKSAGYDVTFARNITDVDDKIINRAKEVGIGPEKLARKFTYSYWHDMASLNVDFPDYEPRATEYITQMIAFVEQLIEGGNAYEAGGDVYFDVSSFKEYGKLGKQDLEQLLVGAREQVINQDALSALKKTPVDFALWKRAAEGELGWASPWGRGRPGWHLECSTMIKHILGESIDLHVGGEDLVFPHHENEIAQSEALHKKPLAKYWLHNGFVQISSEKMSKSLGNFSTIRDLLTTFSPDTIRLFVLQTHYRNPIDFTLESLAATHAGIQRILKAASFAGTSQNGAGVEASPAALSVAEKFKSDFNEAMSNDFNTAIAISHLFQFADAINKTKDEKDRHFQALVLVKHASILGLTLEDRRLQIDSPLGSKLVDLLLNLRQEAKAKKDFASSDLIRKSLTDLGINVMDSAAGVTWERI
ncbi:MAG: cysteine--tRNA ligase [Cyanobacteria bacterium REEB67]|nr:cysteine--tRNA ligase [Cyanobacteria bacterium REEB67]